MKVLIFKDKEDMKLKKNLVALDFEDVVEVEELTKENILDEYRKDENIKIIKTDHMFQNIDDSLFVLCRELGILFTENEFYNEFSLKEISNLPLREALRIIDLPMDLDFNVNSILNLMA